MDFRRSDSSSLVLFGSSLDYFRCCLVFPGSGFGTNVLDFQLDRISVLLWIGSGLFVGSGLVFLEAWIPWFSLDRISVLLWIGSGLFVGSGPLFV